MKKINWTKIASAVLTIGALVWIVFAIFSYEIAKIVPHQTHQTLAQIASGWVIVCIVYIILVVLMSEWEGKDIGSS